MHLEAVLQNLRLYKSPAEVDLMQRAAIYVQPSFWEALGLALQEAMLAGCACIGSRAGGIPELVQHEQNGLLFDCPQRHRATISLPGGMANSLPR